MENRPPAKRPNLLRLLDVYGIAALRRAVREALEREHAARLLGRLT